jgi:hypothetical protein
VRGSAPTQLGVLIRGFAVLAVLGCFAASQARAGAVLDNALENMDKAAYEYSMRVLANKPGEDLVKLKAEIYGPAIRKMDEALADGFAQSLKKYNVKYTTDPSQFVKPRDRKSRTGKYKRKLAEVDPSTNAANVINGGPSAARPPREPTVETSPSLREEVSLDGKDIPKMLVFPAKGKGAQLESKALPGPVVLPPQGR